MKLDRFSTNGPTLNIQASFYNHCGPLRAFLPDVQTHIAIFQIPAISPTITRLTFAETPS